MKKRWFILGISLIIFLVSGMGLASAVDFSSTNFIVRDPIVSIEGGEASSTNFRYFSSTGQTVTGENTSAIFVQRAGFLYFASATSPALSSVAGNGQVTLTWTASVGTNANINTYSVGTSTVMGGPYTFETVGNVLTFTKTPLTNGTSYYFRVRAFAAGEMLAESGEVSATPIAAGVPPPVPSPSTPSGGGGGGGGSYAPSPTGAVFSGRAYPLSQVKILKDGELAAVTTAGTDAAFSYSMKNLTPGTYNFSVMGIDKDGLSSQSFTFSITLGQGATTSVSGIFFAPTIAVDKSEVKKGDDIIIFGQSVPESTITIAVNSSETFLKETNTDTTGVYLYHFDTAVLDFGFHDAKSKVAYKKEVSLFSQPVEFKVGRKTIKADSADLKPESSAVCGKADLNCDKKVNLIDFSIAAFWYKKPLSSDFTKIEKERLNGDGKADLTDFSIMAYHWTG